MSDPEELKAKYAEIAWLKKQIEEKKAARGRRSDKNGISKPSRKQFPTPQINLKPLKVDSGDENYISSTTSRGMTLVNTNIYEREQKLQLLKAEAARKLQIEAQERNRQRKWKPRIDKNKTKTDHCDRIAISDQIFAVCGGGNKLVPLTVPPPDSEGQIIMWNSIKYIRKKNGTFRRVGKSAEYVFSSSQSGNTNVSTSEDCRYYTRIGKYLPNHISLALLTSGICKKSSHCKYLHDPSHIRACRQYLQNKCTNTNCLLNHEPDEHNTPICKYYKQGSCTSPNCHFLHSEKPQDPDLYICLCRPFSVGGWCPRGLKCPFRHDFECPDFEESGTCPRGFSCFLAHPVTKRTQQIMATKTDDDVVIDDEKPTISSFTVDPLQLFVTTNGLYDMYVDEKEPKQDNEFMINLESDSDDLEDNNDYVSV